MKENYSYLPHLAAAVLLLILSGAFGQAGQMIYYLSILAAMVGMYRYLKQFIKITYNACHHFTNAVKKDVDYMEENLNKKEE